MPTRDDEFDGTEYDNTLADLRDEVSNLTDELREAREAADRLSQEVDDLRGDVACAEDDAMRLSDKLDAAHRLLESILEDVRYELQAHERGSRIPGEALDLLYDIADRIREVM